MLDQLRIGDKYSYDDFLASVAERKIGKPKKKAIKETVPYSNKTYDFSKINGEIYWEERELEYILELDAETPEELEELKISLSDWLMNVMEEDLFDPFIEGYHFKATFEDIDFDDSEVEKTTVTVKFSAYPYMLSNEEKTYEVEVNKSVSMINEDGSMTFDDLCALRGTYYLVSPITDEFVYEPTGETIEITFQGVVNVEFIAPPHRKITCGNTLYDFNGYTSKGCDQMTEVEPLTDKVNLTVKNNSSHRVTPTILADSNTTFEFGGSSYAIGEGETTDSSVMLNKGENEFIILPNETGGKLTIKFREEVF